MKELIRLGWGAGIFVLPALVFADFSTGYRERSVVDVPSGETAAGNVVLGDGAAFGKSGAGTLAVDSGKLRAATDARVLVTEGGVRVDGTADADFTTPPDACFQAAYWVDANANIVSTNNVPAEGETASTFVTKWCDRRETDASAPTRIYALPDWCGNEEYPATLTNVPPVSSTFDGRAGIYFGGSTSGQYMNWYLNGSRKVLTDVYHIFVIHAVTNALGHPVGYGVGGRNGPHLNTIGKATSGWSASTPIMYPRGDICSPQVNARFHLDGVKCDGHTTMYKRCWQLWEFDYFVGLPGADDFYKSGFSETLKGCQGGDYLGEALIFTNRLTAADCAAIERYLLAKWNLPDDKGLARRTAATEWVLASNTTAAVSTPASTITPPLAFAGDGTVTKSGDGLLVMGPTDGSGFAGDFLWNGGSIRLQGGRMPALAVASGEKYAFTSFFGSTGTSHDGDAKSGLTCAKTTDAGVGVVETTGNGWLRVNAVSNTVRTLKVGIKTAGLGSVLQLEGRARNVAAPTEGALAAIFINPDLEQPFTISNTSFDRSDFVGTTLNGWTARSGTARLMCIQASQQNKRTWSQWLDSVVPQLGTNILQLVQRVTVSTTVTVPKAGVYELSFDAKARYGSSNDSFNSGYAFRDQQSQIDILLGRDWSGAALVGTLPIGCRNWNRFRYRIAVPEAGTWELGLRAPDTGNDACTFFDNFAMVRIPEPSREEVCVIPNGNFDRLVRPCDPSLPVSGANPYVHGIFTTLNVLTNWTLDVNTAALYGYARTNGVIGALTTGTGVSKSNWMYPFPFADAPMGAGALMMVSTGGTARVSFTVPAGTWRLRGKAEKTPTYWSPNLKDDKNLGGLPKVRARITRTDGTVLDLGLIAPAAWELRTYVWPTALTLAAEETVTLSIEQTVATGIAVLDDLELIRESTRDGENLLSDPGFENGMNVWTRCTKSGCASTYYFSGSVSHSDRPRYWGYSVFEGNCRAYLQNGGGVYQNITVPEAGLYRFTMHVRGRADSSAHANNPVRVFMTQGSVTNELATTPTLFTRHWVEVSYLTQVPAAGTWRFCIEGQCRPEVLAVEAAGGNKADLDAHVDAVSFVRCRDTFDDAPAIPSTLKIEVAEGAQLLLDYAGTAKCGPVKYAGKVYLGTLDAETHPEFITGRGTLEATATGTLLIYR